MSIARGEERRGARAIGTWSSEPTLREVLILAALCSLIYVGLIGLLDNYALQARAFGDNQRYIAIADAIRRWDFVSLHTWLLWGLPYTMVGFSLLTRVSLLVSLLTISMACSFVSVGLATRLWGGWVAAIFAVASREWMERSFLGGAEPLFLALVFASFLAARRQRWLLSTLLASFSTIVRPMGIFALVAIGITLLVRKQFKLLASAVAVGIMVGGLYALPLKLYQGSSLANVKAYGQADGSAGMPVTYPFAALLRPPIVGTVQGETDVTGGKVTRLNLARTAFWVSLLVAGIAAMFLNAQLRQFARSQMVEIVFFAFYATLLFTYNSPWARAAFPRYVIPIIPFVILSFKRWIPKDRRLLWVFGVASTVLSAFSTLGITNSIDNLRRVL